MERSPYAKIISLANWLANEKAYNRGGDLPKRLGNLQDAVDVIIADGSALKVRNIDKYRKPDGSVTVSRWTSETLASDLEKFFVERGLDPVPVPHAKRGTNSDLLDPRKQLREDQIATINELFAEEFERFGWPMIA